MPIYQYKTAEKDKAAQAGCDYCRDGFELMQSMSAKPLSKCPKCKNKVKKIPARVSGGTAMLSNANLRDKGFTKLVNKGGGTYEKVT